MAIEEDIDFIAHLSSVPRKTLAVSRSGRAWLGHKDNLQDRKPGGVDNIDEILDHITVSCRSRDLERDFLQSVFRAYTYDKSRMRVPKTACHSSTQMLHTMIKNPRPTRAEVSDIATAVFNNTDALMLSGETASGAYPVEAVRFMARIAEQAEADRTLYSHKMDVDGADTNLRDFLCKVAIETTSKLGVKCILTDSGTGHDARTLHLPWPHPVVAICKCDKLQRWLALSYGVIATCPKHDELEKMFYHTVRKLYSQGMVKRDDKVTYLSGHMNIGVSDKSAGVSMLEVNSVSEVFDTYEQA